MKLLDSAEVKAQIKLVIQELDDVLHELKTVAAELRAIIQQIDDITARIDLEEKLGKSSQLISVTEMDKMSLSHQRGRPNGQKTAQWGHCAHISDITGGWGSRARCEYPDILVSRYQQITLMRETPILDSEPLYPLEGHDMYRPYKTLDTSQLRRRERVPTAATKSQTLRPRREHRASPLGAESSVEDVLVSHKTWRDSAGRVTATGSLTFRKGPTTTCCVNKRTSSPIVSEYGLDVHGQTARYCLLHGTKLLHTCHRSTCAETSGSGTDSDVSTRLSVASDRLLRRVVGEGDFSSDHSTSSSLHVSDDNVLLMRESTSGCFSCSESNTDSQAEAGNSACLATSKTWRCRTVSDARRRFFRPKVELRNGLGIKYNTIGHVTEKQDTEVTSTRDRRTCSVLMCSKTRVVSTGSQTTEDISDIVAEERVKNYMRDFINLKDEITKL